MAEPQTTRRCGPRKPRRPEFQVRDLRRLPSNVARSRALRRGFLFKRNALALIQLIERAVGHGSAVKKPFKSIVVADESKSAVAHEALDGSIRHRVVLRRRAYRPGLTIKFRSSAVLVAILWIELETNVFRSNVRNRHDWFRTVASTGVAGDDSARWKVSREATPFSGRATGVRASTCPRPR